LKQSILELPPINHDYQQVTSRKILSASRWLGHSQTIGFLIRCGRSRKPHRTGIALKRRMRLANSANYTRRKMEQ
jgi:hypothetical protein